MKKLIWKITYKIAEKWMRVAKRNRLDEQEMDCIRILVDLEMYKGHMQEKGLWQEWEEYARYKQLRDELQRST